MALAAWALRSFLTPTLLSVPTGVNRNDNNVSGGFLSRFCNFRLRISLCSELSVLFLYSFPNFFFCSYNCFRLTAVAVPRDLGERFARGPPPTSIACNLELLLAIALRIA